MGHSKISIRSESIRALFEEYITRIIFVVSGILIAPLQIMQKYSMHEEVANLYLWTSIFILIVLFYFKILPHFSNLTHRKGLFIFYGASSIIFLIAINLWIHLIVDIYYAFNNINLDFGKFLLRYVEFYLSPTIAILVFIEIASKYFKEKKDDGSKDDNMPLLN